MTLKIVNKNDHRIVYASGFYSQYRAEQWLQHYDPRMWVDKTTRREDLEIVEEGVK